MTKQYALILVSEGDLVSIKTKNNNNFSPKLTSWVDTEALWEVDPVGQQAGMETTQLTAGPGKQNELSCQGKVLLLDAVETSKHVQRAVDKFVSTLSFKVQQSGFRSE